MSCFGCVTSGRNESKKKKKSKIEDSARIRPNSRLSVGSSSSGNRLAFLRFLSFWLLIICVAIFFFGRGLNSVAFAASSRGTRSSANNGKKKENGTGSRRSNAAQCFNFRDMAIASRNFRDLIGEGGFGKVYKGRLDTGEARFTFPLFIYVFVFMYLHYA